MAKQTTPWQGDGLKPGYRELPDPLAQGDLNWLAGLLEGEGHFSLHARTHSYPRISVQMADDDVVARAAQLFGGNKVRAMPVRPNRKPTYRTEVSGRTAASLMRQLRPLMGQRRAAKIDEVLAGWEARGDRRTND